MLRTMLVLMSLTAVAAPAFAAEEREPVVADFDSPFLFSYGTWQEKVKTDSGNALLRGINGKGGAGQLIDRDFREFAQFSPQLRIRVNADNRAKAIRLTLMSPAERASTWWFDLPAAASDEFITLIARDGAAMTEPNAVHDRHGAADLGKIIQVQLQGDWQDKVLDVAIDEVRLVAPTQEILTARQALADRKAADAERSRVAKAEALKRIQHRSSSPTIEHVGTVSPSLIEIRLQAGRLVIKPAIQYVPDATDEIRNPEKHQALAFDRGNLGLVPEQRFVFRKIGTEMKLVGTLVGGADAGSEPMFKPADEIDGDPLEILTVEDPTSYAIVSADDEAYTTPVMPTAVHRKSVPNNRGEPVGERMTMRHTIFLRLPKPLSPGKKYQIEFKGVNTQKPSVELHYDTSALRSEAVHISHVGYRADDPFKRAMLSTWLGTGGAYSFDQATTFELLDDASGKVTYTGRVQRILAADATEKLREQKNYSQTAVYSMDFSDFSTPGTYRVHVPGTGCSYPFRIGEETWKTAFHTSMKGFLHHRSGIALAPPTTDYVRPRPRHPEDGVKVFRSAISLPHALKLAPNDWFAGFVAHRTEATEPQAWGGYMDAGDWDSIANHMTASQLHLELFDLFPGFFAQMRLAVPEAELKNNIPDLLDEVIWNVGLFQRTQTEDGGITGQVEYSAHPRLGETSWNNTLAVMITKPDPESSYVYAATAARLSRLLKPYDAPHADVLAQSARRAWDYAQRNAKQFEQELDNRYGEALAKTRPLAAVELLLLTRNKEFDDAFTAGAADDVLTSPEAQPAAFAYARLPADLGDAATKARCRRLILESAERSIAFADGNAFGITTDIPSLPEIGFVGYFSTPGILTQPLPRAHYLTGDAKYLASAIRSCNYSVGANPLNMSYTTGVGPVTPGAVLHMDSRATGQPAPAGVTVYGQSDPSRGDGFNEWVHTWVIGNVTTPASRSWPATEAYVDLYKWPAMNEYTVRQTMGPTSYTWGYLAARR